MPSYSERLKIPITGVSPEMEDFLENVISILDQHVKHHFDILKTMEFELKIRPTFEQATKHFRLNVAPMYLDVAVNPNTSEFIQSLQREFEYEPRTNPTLYIDTAYVDFMLSKSDNTFENQTNQILDNLTKTKEDMTFFKMRTTAALKSTEQLLFTTRQELNDLRLKFTQDRLQMRSRLLKQSVLNSLKANRLKSLQQKQAIKHLLRHRHKSKLANSFVNLKSALSKSKSAELHGKWQMTLSEIQQMQERLDRVERHINLKQLQTKKIDQVKQEVKKTDDTGIQQVCADMYAYIDAAVQRVQGQVAKGRVIVVIL